MKKLWNKFKGVMNEDREGAVAFEYIIILVIMAVAIFVAWRLLSTEIKKKAGEIAKFIKNNGQNQSDLGGAAGGNAVRP